MMESDEAGNSLGAPARTLLVIDDDLVQRSIIKRIGAQLGFASTAVACYEDAEQLLRRENFDCITLDLSLGGHDGVEVLHLLAQLGRATPVVIISGCEERVLNSAVGVAQSLGLAISAPLSKPLNLSELRRSLMNYCDRPAQTAAAPDFSGDISVELRSALDAGAIDVALLPRMKLASGVVAGCVALPFWPRSSVGHFEGDALAKLAADADLAPALEACALDRALKHAADPAAKNPVAPVVVDLSAFLAAEANAVGAIEQKLVNYTLAPESLMVGVRHAALAADPDRLLDALVRLRIKRIGTVLLDFGSAPLQLVQFGRMPLAEVVLDPDLTRTVRDHAELRKVASAAIAMAHAFGMSVSAVNVGQAGAVMALRECGCDLASGSAIAPPVAPAQMPQAIEAWRGGVGPREAPPLAASRQAS